MTLARIPTRRALLLAVALLLTLAASVVTTVVAQRPAGAACYTRSRTLRSGMSGSDVTQLQIRVAGYATDHDIVATDGQYGAKTAAAVARFQAAYGLSADGVAGPTTFSKVYSLTDSDCTPAHFAYSEFYSKEGQQFNGGKVSASKVQDNVFRLMWKLEALRHRLGDHPLTVVSGFRSIAHNKALGGASNSQHLYGNAADLTSGSSSLCRIAKTARSGGFSGILGPGAEGHADHTHVDSRLENNDDGLTNAWYWDAPSCF